jgi:hypothetical protein
MVSLYCAWESVGSQSPGMISSSGGAGAGARGGPPFAPGLFSSSIIDCERVFAGTAVGIPSMS